MKRFLLLSYIGLLTSLAYAVDLGVNQITMMVEKIHQRRVGVDLPTLEHINVPFVRVEKKDDNTTELVVATKRKETKEKPLELHGILGKRAFINGKWYKEKDKVRGFELVYVGKNGVVLKNDKRIKTLFLIKKQSESLLKFNER